MRAVSDVCYVAIKRNLYLAAKRATLMERSKKLGGDLGSNEPIDLEVEKVNVIIINTLHLIRMLKMGFSALFCVVASFAR